MTDSTSKTAGQATTRAAATGANAALSPEQEKGATAAKGESAERARLRELIGAGADSQMGLPPGRTTSDVVSTEHPKSIDYGKPPARYNADEHREALEREAAAGDRRQSAVHLTDPGLANATPSKGDGGSAHVGTGNTARTGAAGAGAGASGGTATGGSAGGSTGGAGGAI